MNCIICQDTGQEPLQDNTACSCKYKYHTSCWIDYVHSTTKANCLLCRKLLTPNPKSTAPYSSEPANDHTPLLSSQPTSTAPPTVRRIIQKAPIVNKVCGAILVLGMIAMIVVMFVVLL